MSGFDSGVKTTHPLGWPLIGFGAILWLIPLKWWLSPDSDLTLPTWVTDPAVLVTGAVVSLTLLGLLLESTAGERIERLWIWWTKKRRPEALNACSAAWDAAQIYRWKYPVLDAEFRRHEGINSFARAYALHSFLSGLMWPVWLIASGTRWWTPVVVFLAGVLGVVLFYRIWLKNTRTINDHKVKTPYRLREEL